MRLLIVACLVLFSISIFAQSPISKGTIILNGNIYYSSQNYDNSNRNTSILRINPQAGYFLFDNLAVNLDLSYELIDIGTDISRYGIGPNLRYYFDFENYFPFYSLGYAYTYETYGSSENNQGHQFILGAGISFLITKNVAVETSISYKFDQVRSDNSNYFSDEIVKSKIFMLGIGFNYYLY